MADVALMDSESIDLILASQTRLENDRAPYESVWRDVDRFVDPFGAGSFDKVKGYNREIEDLYDVTAIDGLDRYTAAIAGITVPRQQQWHGVEFADVELMKIASVKRWCESTAKRLFIARYAPNAGFEAQIHTDIRQEGKYGCSPLWVGEMPGVGLFYNTLHMSQCYFAENYYGRVDRFHRKWCEPLRQVVKQYGLENLSERSRQNWEDPKKRDGEIELLHVIAPNDSYEPGYLGTKGMPFVSITIELGEKHAIRRKGFHSFPVPVSRHITAPNDPYGRSPAMKVLASTKGLQAMARTILDAGNRIVDPPLLFHDDGDITKVSTKPGGLTPGGVNEQGQQLVHPLVTGAQLPIGLELQQAEREIVKRAFLEEFFRLLSDPSDRMTATQVMETLQKEGVLVGPFAGRRETEKLGPMIEREIDIMLRAGVLEPLPDEVKEAGARPKVRMTNPLSRMARAEQVTGFTRLAEIGFQAAAAGRPEALDPINFDAGMRLAADVLGAPPSIIYSEDEIAAKRQAQQDKQDAAMEAQMAPDMADAALKAAKANEIAARLDGGGGL